MSNVGLSDLKYSDGYNGKYANDSLIYDMSTVASNLEEQFSQIHEDMNRNFNMLVTDLQWSEADRQKLIDENRPALSYNIISPLIKTIVGVQWAGRKRVQVVGRTNNDHRFADVMTKVLDFSYKKTHADYHLSRAAMDAVSGRVGFLQMTWSYKDDPEGRLCIRRIHPLRLKWDLDTMSSPNMEDCRYILDTNFMTDDKLMMHYAANDDELSELIETRTREFMEIYQQQSARSSVGWISKLIQSTRSMISPSDRFMSKHSGSLNDDLWYNPETNEFQVLELHEKRVEKRVLLHDQMLGVQVDITKDVMKNGKVDRNLLAAVRQSAMEPKVVEKNVEVMYITTVIPALMIKVQEMPAPIQNGQFCFTPVFSINFHPDANKIQSFVDELVDLQREFNKRRSTKLEFLQRASLGGYVVEESAISGFEEEWYNRKIGSFKRVRDGRMSGVREDQALSFPTALQEEEQLLPFLMEQISGINKASRGLQDSSNETGRLFLAKKEQGETMLQFFFQNIEIASLHLARNAVDMIQHYMTAPRIIRISADAPRGNMTVSGSSDPQKEQEDLKINWEIAGEIKNNLSIPDFDLEISSAPYGDTARQIEYAKLLDMFNLVASFDPMAAKSMLPILIKASDMPYRDEILASLKAAEENPMQQQMQQLQIQKLQADTQRVAADTQRLSADSQKSSAEAQKTTAEIQKMAFDTGMSGQEAAANLRRAKEDTKQVIQNQIKTRAETEKLLAEIRDMMRDEMVDETLLKEVKGALKR